MASTGIYNGTLIGIYIGGTLIAKSTSCRMEVTSETRDTTTKDSSGWRDKEYTIRQATFSGDFLDAEDAAYRFDDLFALISAKTKATVRMTSDVVGDKYYEATCVLTSLSREAPMEDNVAGAYTFESSGAITEGTEA